MVIVHPEAKPGSTATPVAVAAERKHVTILFADLVGSTALCERLDPEDVHALIDRWLQQMTEEVYRYGGIINQFSGDGILALFGAPLAYEDAPQRACHAALAMQRRVATLNREQHVALAMRVGIDTGEAFVGTLGSELRKEYAALGHRTNRAKRIQEAAPPGTVLVGEETARLVAPYFLFAELAEFTAKGVSEPLQACRLIGAAATRARLDATLARWQPRLVGRAAELAVLRHHLDELRVGHGQLIWLEGEPGAGKSRLAAELTQMATTRDVAVWEGRGLPYGDRLAYGLFVDAIRHGCGITDDDTAASVRQKLQHAGGSQQAAVFQAHDLAFLEALLGVAAGDSALRQLDPEAGKAGIFAAVCDLVGVHAAERPLVIVLDDFHWADEQSRELADFLVQRIDTLPVLLCVVSRPGAMPLPSQSNFTRLSVACLTVADTAEMILSLLPVQDEAHRVSFSAWVREVSGGNPLFVEEVLQALLADGKVAPGVGGWHVIGDLADMDVPATLQDLIGARVDRLPAPEKEMLQEASVIGNEFSVAVLRRCHPQGDVDAILATLAQKELLCEAGAGADRVCRFKHGLTWQVAYNTLPQSRRGPLHERVGAALEHTHVQNPEPYYRLLAHHYTRSPNAAKAIVFLRRAGEQAQRAYANAEAEGYFTNALEKAERVAARDDQIELLLARGEIRSKFLGDYPGALADFGAALAAAQSGAHPRATGRALLGQGNTFLCQYQMDDALSCFAEAARHAAATHCTREYIEALVHQGVLLGEREEFDRGLACLEEALRASRGLSDRSLEIQALIQLGRLQYRRAQYGDALRTYDECVALCQAAGDQVALSLALQNQSIVYTWGLFDHRRAIEVNETLQQLLLELGDKRRLANSVINMATSWLGLGEEQKALECYEQALARFRELGITYWIKWSLLTLRSLYAKMDRVEDHVRCLEEAIPLVRDEGDIEQAAELFRELGQACAGRGEKGRAARAFGSAAKLYIEKDDTRQAMACLALAEQAKAGG